MTSLRTYILVIPLRDIKLMMNGKDTYDTSVDSACPKYSETLRTVNGNVPIDYSFVENLRKSKEELNMKEESSEEDENSPIKKRIVGVVSKRNRLVNSNDSSSSEEEYNPSKKKVLRIISKDNTFKSKVDSETESEDETSKSKVDSELESEQSSDEKTPYEKMIEKRRAEHKALLQELKLKDIKAGLLEAIGSLKHKTQPVRKISRPQACGTVRRSKRISENNEKQGEMMSPEEFTEFFIRTVESFPILYDNRHFEYNDVAKKATIWKRIANICNLEDGNTAKNKWTYLRSYFRTIISKENTESGQAASTNKSWQFKEQMMFLKDSLEFWVTDCQ